MLTNEEKINLRERALRLANELWFEQTDITILELAKDFYQFLTRDLDDDPLRLNVSSPCDGECCMNFDEWGCRESRHGEIDWSRQQLLKSISDKVVVRTDGNHLGYHFSGTAIGGEFRRDWCKSFFKYHGEIPEDKSIKLPDISMGIFEAAEQYASMFDNNYHRNSGFIHGAEWQYGKQKISASQEPKTTGLNFLEAMKLCKEGKNVRRSVWPSGSYIGESVGSVYKLITGDGDEFHTSDLRNFLATDWQIVNH